MAEINEYFHASRSSSCAQTKKQQQQQQQLQDFSIKLFILFWDFLILSRTLIREIRKQKLYELKFSCELNVIAKVKTYIIPFANGYDYSLRVIPKQEE
jgi:hypothetical protein